jgi:hypothetical protein
MLLSVMHNLARFLHSLRPNSSTPYPLCLGSATECFIIKHVVVRDAQPGKIPAQLAYLKRKVIMHQDYRNYGQNSPEGVDSPGGEQIIKFGPLVISLF